MLDRESTKSLLVRKLVVVGSTMARMVAFAFLFSSSTIMLLLLHHVLGVLH